MAEESRDLWTLVASGRRRRGPIAIAGAAVTIILMVGAFPGVAAPDGPDVMNPVSITEVTPGRYLLAMPAPLPSGIDSGWRVFLCRGAKPVAMVPLSEETDQGIVIAAPAGGPAKEGGDLRAWVVPPDLVAAMLDQWPMDGPLVADIDSLGPGRQSAWLRAGSNEGVRAGDCWWMRVGGQPVARFEVRYVAADVCYSAVVPLVSGLRLKAGDRVAAWPAPGERNSGRSTSAVSYVEQPSSQGLVVWVAIPPGAGAAAGEPHVDFYRGGRFVGFGLAERRDTRFWYVNVTPTQGPMAGGGRLAETRPSGLPTSAGAQSAPASRGRESVGGRVDVRVGDDAVVRTPADVENRRFAARVFERSAGSFLINAGELDGLAEGQEGVLVRDGNSIGRVEIVEVERSYASVVGIDRGQDAPPEIRLGDEVWVGPIPRPATCIGEVIGVTDRLLLSVRLLESSAPLQVPLAVRAEGRTVAVAVLVVAEGKEAAGLVLPASVLGPVSAGMRLFRETTAGGEP